MKKEKREAVINIRVPNRVKDNLLKEADSIGNGTTLSDICNNKLDNANSN